MTVVRAPKQAPLLKILILLLIAGVIGSMLLPWVNAPYGGALYAVRGIDMVTGRGVPTDKYGMLPQLGAVLCFIALVAAAGVFLMRNRDKSAFLSGLLSLLALCMQLVLLRADEMQGTFDPIIAAFTKRAVQPGYLVTAALLVLLIALQVAHITRQRELMRDLKLSRWLYFMAVPVVVYAFIFFYYPIYGVIIAFKDFSPRLGILGSPWVGLENFMSFFRSTFFQRLITNTLMISFLDILFGFTSPIIFALMLNEVKNSAFRRTVQTITYLPHFISLVVLCGLIKDFTTTTGLINGILLELGVPKEYLKNYLMEARYFRSVYTISGIWQHLGWNSIMYLAALTTIDPQLYEAARVDGAKRWAITWHVTLPGILPTIVVLFILRLGSVMSVGFEKIILLYSDATYRTADVISSFVYRRGLVESNYSFATAVDLFNQVINLMLVLITNRISRRVSEISLW